MDQNNPLNAPNQIDSSNPSDILKRPFLKVLLGFLGWFLLTLPVINFPDFLYGAYVPANIVIAAVLLLWKRTRWIGLGFTGAIAANFLVSSILGTVISPRHLAPIIHPDVYQRRWNFNSHYVSKGVRPELFSECVDQINSTGNPNLTLGRIAFTRIGTKTEIYLMNAEGTEHKNLTSPPNSDYDPAWSPDGKQIAFTSLHDNDMDIYIMNGDGSNQKNLTNHPEYDIDPVWSPDGKQLAFTSNRDGNPEIYVMNADGSGQKGLTKNSGQDYSPSWSPDGAQIAFTSDREGNFEIYIMSADGSGQTNLTRDPGSDIDPVWSPNGELISFSSNRNFLHQEMDKSGIHIMNSDGTDVRQITEDSTTGFWPVWSPNGNCLLYQSQMDFLNDWIMLVKVNNLKPVRLVHGGAFPRWSPDGRWVVYTVVSGEWNNDIYKLDLSTLQTYRLTSDTVNDVNPLWKP